jgi:rhamnosyltransferase
MLKKKFELVSIIIRTKNEEKWIGHCLETIYNQKVDADFEIILVDNESTDNTVKIAKRYSVDKIIYIKNFLPGKALNDGIRVSNGKYIVCLSAHCIPEKESWLQKMLCNFKKHKNIAGVYGRQLPLTYTDPVDKRDLLIVFGLDKKIQEKDYFFHNANSIIPRSIWERFPFDENVTNIEDRVWGKQVIQGGLNIIYEPEASVYHHHGLHQGNKNDRLKGVVTILEKISSKEINGIPNTMMPNNINVAAFIPIIGKISEKNNQFDNLHKVIDQLKKSRFIKSIYYLADYKFLKKESSIKWLNRKIIKNADDLSLNELMCNSLQLIEDNGDSPDRIVYINPDYVNRPNTIFDTLISDAQHKGFDTLFPGLVDYGHYWYQKEGDYKQTDPSLKPRTEREPIYKALYGVGCVISPWVLRGGKMIGGKVGILEIDNDKYAKREKP